jgi:UPF0755 protein
MEFWFNLKRKIMFLLERDPAHVRLLAWRNRVTTVLVFLDTHFVRITVSAILIFIFLIPINLLFWRAPKPFPEQALINVERGESLTQIANDFETSRVVRSSFWLKSLIILFGGQKRVVAGDYYFPAPKNVFSVAWTLHRGEFGLIPLKMTIPEGTSSFEIAKMLEKNLPAFKADDFIKEVADGNFEGYLFPDTYFFMPNTKASDVILMMRENFARQIKPYEADILKFKKPLNEIVIMASIIEDEAGKGLETKRIVSGILWKRLRSDMPLQVDAPFQYYNGKNSYTLTKDDLAEDHPYNTYKNKGLPPTAITNPGIDSIRAAITPTQTSYLYFLSDKSGNMYYAKDFDGHKQNRELHLN